MNICLYIHKKKKSRKIDLNVNSRAEREVVKSAYFKSNPGSTINYVTLKKMFTYQSLRFLYKTEITVFH